MATVKQSCEPITALGVPGPPYPHPRSLTPVADRSLTPFADRSPFADRRLTPVADRILNPFVARARAFWFARFCQ